MSSTSLTRLVLRTHLAVIAALLTGLTSHAAAQTPFTPGDVVVVRMGDGAAALSANATPVFLEEWNPVTSTLVQTINLTTAGTNVVTSSGTATSEGFLTLSSNGQYLVYAGYKTAVGTAGITGSTSASINRVIARIGINGSVDTSTALTDAVSGGNPRCAITTDGQLFWLCGSVGGVRHAASLGATTSAQLNSTLPVNLRVIGIANGQLYASSSASANFGVNSVGSGLPTTSGQTVSILPGFPTAAGPSSYDFWFADANTVYLADDRAVPNGGLQKWTFNGSTWSLAYTLNSGLTGGLRGVSGVPGSSPPRLFVTSTDSKLLEATDNGSSVASPFATRTTVGSNRAFRGLRYLPVAAPVIDTQPTSAVACAGSGASFTVGASGSGLAYQWRKGGVGVGGANAATYSIAAVGTGDIGSYDCVVSNAGGSVTSSAATLTVNVGPTIDTSPSSATVCAGGGASFSVAVSGTAPFSYQWRRNGSDVAGANGATLSIASAAPADAGSYDCVVANSCSQSTSAAATLTVNASAAISVQPVDATACSGNAASFSVTATGTAPITYQWRKGGTPIPGATSATYAIAAATAADAGAYDCEVSNACGNASSGFATLTVDEAAAISVQPVDATACSGNGASFSVTATGTAPITYQWRKGGTPIPGATSATYAIAAATAADAGAYDCEVSNACGNASSGFATLTVDEAAAISVQPVDATACSGNAASFSVTATGTAPITYQWRKGGTPIAGATSATYAIAAATAADAGAYDCEVSNACGTAASNFATLTVDEAAAVSVQPVDATACSGNAASFSVTATGTAPITYQWRKGGTPIPGATSATYAIAAATAADAGAYDCEVSNACGNAASNFAMLTVDEAAAITVHPIGLTVLVGNSASFAVTATGTAPLALQWRKNGVPIAGATAATFAIAAVTAGDAGSYDVEVSNGCGSTTSNAATLLVTDVPALEVQCQGVGSATLTVALGDVFAGNGNDVIVADAAANTVQVLRNDGSGHFAPQPALAVAGGPRGIAVADFDRDGYVDLAVACPLGGSVQVLYGDGAGGFASPIAIAATAPTAVAAVAVLGHTDPDLVIADGSTLLLAGNASNGTPGTRAFGATSVLVAGTSFTAVAIGDVTGDGVPEIAATDSGPGLVHLIDSLSLAAASPPLPCGVGPQALAVRDFDGDLRADLAVAGTSGLTLLRAPALLPVTVDAMPAVAVAAGRFDVDDHVDLAYVTALGATVVLHDAQGPITPGSFETLPSPTAANGMAAGACNPTGLPAGPAADTDELVLARTTGDVCVVRCRGQAQAVAIAGTGCGGATPTCSVTGGAPVIGNAAFGSALDLATPSTLAVLAYQGHFPAGSPLLLSSLGGCAHAFDAGDLPLLFALVDGSGHAEVSLAVPAQPIFIGGEFPIQWAVFDGGPFLGLTLSQALLLRIGEY